MEDGVLRKNEGQERVFNNTPDKWKEDAINVIRQVARKEKLFIVDSVRKLAKELEIGEPRNHAIWGAVFKEAARRKIIQKTNRYRPSHWKSNNFGPRTIWRSCLFRS